MKKFYSLFSLILCWGMSVHAQWTTSNPGFSQATSIAGFSSPSAQVVWLAGRDTSATVPGNRFARSTNEGVSWNTFTIAGFGSYTPSNITALNADTAWVAMYNSTGGGSIFRTNNGGISWTQQTTATFAAPGGFPNFVHFFDANNGVCMGDPNGGYFEIYTTSDGGSNWSRVAQVNIPDPENVEYGTVNKYSAAGNLVSFTTTAGRVFISQNQGLSWMVSPILVGSDTSVVQWVQAKSATELMALCYVANGNLYKLMRSTDAGISWQAVDWLSGSLSINNVGYTPLSAYSGLHMSLNGSSANFSYDNGKTWRPLTFNLNNAGLSEGSVGSSPNGTMWLGGRYLNGSQTGLVHFTTPTKDLAVISAQVGGGKTNCYGNDTMEVVLLNTGSTPLSFGTDNATLRFWIYERPLGNQNFNNGYELTQTLSSGVLNPGASMVQKYAGWAIDPSQTEYYIKSIAVLSGSTAENYWNDSSAFLFINGQRKISLTDSITSTATSLLYKGAKGILNCSGAISSIQWQSRTITGSWTNEPNATNATYTFTATETKYYRAIVCGNLSTDSVLLVVPEIGEAVGYTYFSNQTNGSINNRINISGTKLSAAFTGSMDNTNTSTPDRGSFYNSFNGTNWGAPATTRLESIRTGFPTLTTTATGKEIIVAHNSATQKLTLLRRNTVGVGTWTEVADFAKGMWPRIIAGNGDTIHVISMDSSRTIGAQIRYYRSPDAGTTWDIATDLPGYTVANGFASTNAETYTIQSKGNLVVIVAGGYNNKLQLWKSVNSGQSWTTSTIKNFPAGMDGNSILPQTLTTDGIVSVVIDNNNMVNVFTGKMFLQDDVAGDGTWNYFPNTDALLFWKESWGPDSLIEIATAAQTGYLTGTFVTSNSAGLASYPSASMDATTGALYVTFSIPVFGTADGITDVSRRDVFGIMSPNGGNSWSFPQNLTKTAESGIDNSFASTANNSSGLVHALWQSSLTPVTANDTRVNLKTIVHEAFPYNRFESLVVNQLANSIVCGNDSVDITYSTVGMFGSVSIELSDSVFKFDNPIVLGTFSNTNSEVTRRVKVPNAYQQHTLVFRIKASTGQVSNISEITITPKPNKPVISHTRPLTFCNGDSTVLTVDTLQIGTHNHYWEINGVMDGSSYNKLSYIVSTTSNVQVSVNPYGCGVRSDTIKVVRNSVQAIAVNLTPDTIVCPGTALTLKAVVVAGTPSSYQWYKDGATTGTNSPNLVLSSINPASAAKYSISITSQCAIYNSDTIEVRVNDKPVITAQPISYSTCDGLTAEFTIATASLTPVVYEWRRGSQIVGSGPSLVIPNAAITDTGTYLCTATNQCGTTNSQTVTLTVVELPAIHTSLLDTTVCKGNTLDLSIDATGTAIVYNWFKDSTAVGIGSTLTLNNIDLTNAGSYHVEVSNGCGMAASNSANVAVTDAAVVEIVLLSGDSLVAHITGSYTSISWYVNDSLISGANDTILAATRSGVYHARVLSGNSCENVSTPFDHIKTGLKTVESAVKIGVYPNPANTQLHVNGVISEYDEVYVTDLLGKKLMSQYAGKGPVLIDVSGLPSGMYILQVRTSKGLALQKIQVQH